MSGPKTFLSQNRTPQGSLKDNLSGEAALTMKFFHALRNGVCHTTVYKDCSQPELIKSINRYMQSRPSCHYGKPLSVTERCFSWMMLEFFRCWNSFSELMRHHNWNSTDRNSVLYLIYWHHPWSTLTLACRSLL